MNSFRYDKLNALIHLQNQKAHYRRIIEAKKNINFRKMDTRKFGIQCCNNKVEKEKQKQRKQTNMKLEKKIEQINNRNGLLQKMDMHSKEASKKKQARCLSRSSKTQPQNSMYGTKFKVQDIGRQNMKIMERLKEVKPSIGSQREWKAHFKVFKDNEKKLRKHSLEKGYDPELKLKETLSNLQDGKVSDLYTLYRLESLTRNREAPQEREHPASRERVKTANEPTRARKSGNKRRRRQFKSQNSKNSKNNHNSHNSVYLSQDQEHSRLDGPNKRIFFSSEKLSDKSESLCEQDEQLKSNMNSILSESYQPIASTEIDSKYE